MGGSRGTRGSARSSGCSCLGLVSSHRRQLSQGGATAVVILGDASSAGYLSDDNGERAFVDAAARGAGMSVVTGELGCSEYWKQSEGVYSPSLLDQAVATEGVVKSGSAKVHGYYEALGCKAYRGKGRRRGAPRAPAPTPPPRSAGRSSDGETGM